MLTKEECEEALENISNLELQEYEGLYGRIKYVGDIRFCDYRLLRILIKEHFDNPPLEFEELKQGMWVWDNKDKKYNKITEINGDKIGFYYITSDVMRYICKFKPNRFYRKEVQE